MDVDNVIDLIENVVTEVEVNNVIKVMLVKDIMSVTLDIFVITVNNVVTSKISDINGEINMLSIAANNNFLINITFFPHLLYLV